MDASVTRLCPDFFGLGRPIILSVKSLWIMLCIYLFFFSILYFVLKLLRGSMVCNVAFVWTNYFINALQILRALSTGATTVTCAPEPITAELKPTTYLKKQADSYLQRHKLDWDFAGGLVPFCASKLLWINETKRVQDESVQVWGDLETRGQQSGIGICGCSCVASC